MRLARRRGSGARYRSAGRSDEPRIAFATTAGESLDEDDVRGRGFPLPNDYATTTRSMARNVSMEDPAAS